MIHEVVDLPHGHAPHVDEEDEAQQHQVVFWRHPQYKLQVEGVQLGQQELRRRRRKRRKRRNPSHISNTSTTKKYQYQYHQSTHHEDDAQHGQPAPHCGRRLPLKLDPTVGCELERNALDLPPGGDTEQHNTHIVTLFKIQQLWKLKKKNKKTKESKVIQSAKGQVWNI